MIIKNFNQIVPAVLSGQKELVFGIKNPEEVVKTLPINKIMNVFSVIENNGVKVIGKGNRVVNFDVYQILRVGIKSKGVCLDDLISESKNSKQLAAKLYCLRALMCPSVEEELHIATSFEDAHNELCLDPVFYSAIAEKPDQDLNAEAYKDIVVKKYSKSNLNIKMNNKVYPKWVKKDGLWTKEVMLKEAYAKRLAEKFKGLTFDGVNHYDEEPLDEPNILEEQEHILRIYAKMLDTGWNRNTMIVVNEAIKNEELFFIMIDFNLPVNFFRDNWMYIPKTYKPRLKEIIKDRIEKGLMLDDEVLLFGKETLIYKDEDNNYKFFADEENEE